MFDNLYYSVKKYSFFVFFCISIIIFIFLNYIYCIRYEENDDLVMLLIASGKYTGTPDAHLIFMNFTYGYFLNILYKIYSGIEWYTISLVFVNVLSVSVISNLIHRTVDKTIFKMFLWFFMFSVFLYISCLLQFTKTAAIASIAGVCLIYNIENKQKYKGILLLILGSLIRFEAAILILIMSLPLFVLPKFKDSFSYKNSKFLVIMVAAILFLKVLDYSYYHSNPDWKAYIQYNRVRGKINDNPNAKSTFLKLPKEVTKEDYTLLLKALTNLSAIDYSNLEKIYESIDSKPIISKLRNVFQLLHYKTWILILCCIIFLILLLNRKNWKQTLLFLVIFFGVIGLLAINAKVKHRVFFPALIGVVCFLFIKNKSNTLSKWSITPFIALFVLSLMLIKQIHKEAESSCSQALRFKKQNEFINAYLTGNNIIIPAGSTYQIQFCNPFEVSKSFPSQKLLFPGWMTGIPFNANKFDSFKFLIDGYGLFVNQGNAKEYKELIVSSILLNYNIQVEPIIKLENDHFFIIEFHAK